MRTFASWCIICGREFVVMLPYTTQASCIPCSRTLRGRWLLRLLMKIAVGLALCVAIVALIAMVMT